MISLKFNKHSCFWWVIVSFGSLCLIVIMFWHWRQQEHIKHFNLLQKRIITYSEDVKRRTQIVAKIDSVCEEARKAVHFESELNGKFSFPLVILPYDYTEMEKTDNFVGIYWITVSAYMTLDDIREVAPSLFDNYDWIFGQLRRTSDSDEPLDFAYSNKYESRIYSLSSKDPKTSMLMKQMKKRSNCLVILAHAKCYPFRIIPAPTRLSDFDVTTIQSVAFFYYAGSEIVGSYNTVVDEFGRKIGTIKGAMVVDDSGEPIRSTTGQLLYADSKAREHILKVCVVSLPEYKVITSRTFRARESTEVGVGLPWKDALKDTYSQALSWLEQNMPETDRGIYEVEDFGLPRRGELYHSAPDCFTNLINRKISENIVVESAP